MIKQTNFTIRKFDPSDIDGIIALLNHVFKPKFTRDWWKWKYELNPNGFWGQDGDIWVAESNDRIIGHYAVLPEKIKYYSKVVDMAQSVDTAVHPDYRGLGIFSMLARKVYSDAKSRYSFLLGFPSEMAHGGFLKLGWKDLSSLQEHTKILNYNALIGRKFKNPLYAMSGKIFLKTYCRLTEISKTFSPRIIRGNEAEIDKVESFPAEIGAFWDQNREYYSVVLERTSLFLNWRFSKIFGEYQIFIGRSKKNKKILGYIVLRKAANTLDVIDLISLPNEDKALLQLIDVAIETGTNAGVDSLRCLFPKWHKTTAILAKKGFISPKPLRFRGKYIPQFIYYNLTGKDSPVNEWFYTYADTDYV